MRVRTAGWIATATAVAVLAAGCGGDDADETSGGFTDASAAVEDGVEADEAAEEEAALGDVGGEDGARAADDVVTFGEGEVVGRQLARTASITVEVADIEEAARAVSAAATRAGGYVESADVQGGDFGYGQLTVRVPAASLDGTLQQLAEVGVRVVSSGISTQDLTDQLVDLDARIDNLERLETELLELLTRIEDSDANATQLLAVYERISSVRGDIERLEAQRAAAADRVALATIRVELVATAIAPEEVEPEPETTLGRAWEATRNAFGAIGDALVWLVVTILPVALVVGALPLLLLWLLVRGLRQRRGGRGGGHAQQGPGATPGPPPVTGTAPSTGERAPEDRVTTGASTPASTPRDD